ncbi:MAG: hypothetical protein HY908_19910 [Myxococcales bacterium]|nr:hypothetical protein [Myxococcales bacterium]
MKREALFGTMVVALLLAAVSACGKALPEGGPGGTGGDGASSSTGSGDATGGTGGTTASGDGPCVLDESQLDHCTLE